MQRRHRGRAEDAQRMHGSAAPGPSHESEGIVGLGLVAGIAGRGARMGRARGGLAAGQRASADYAQCSLGPSPDRTCLRAARKTDGNKWLLPSPLALHRDLVSTALIPAPVHAWPAAWWASCARALSHAAPRCTPRMTPPDGLGRGRVASAACIIAEALVLQVPSHRATHPHHTHSHPAPVCLGLLLTSTCALPPSTAIAIALPLPLPLPLPFSGSGVGTSVGPGTFVGPAPGFIVG